MEIALTERLLRQAVRWNSSHRHLSDVSPVKARLRSLQDVARMSPASASRRVTSVRTRDSISDGKLFRRSFFASFRTLRTEVEKPPEEDNSSIVALNTAIKVAAELNAARAKRVGAFENEIQGETKGETKGDDGSSDQYSSDQSNKPPVLSAAAASARIASSADHRRIKSDTKSWKKLNQIMLQRAVASIPAYIERCSLMGK